MSSINKDQLVRYIKGLEKKVKEYQSILKDRDQEIQQLKERLQVSARPGEASRSSLDESLPDSLTQPASPPKVKRLTAKQEATMKPLAKPTKPEPVQPIQPVSVIDEFENKPVSLSCDGLVDDEPVDDVIQEEDDLWVEAVDPAFTAKIDFLVKPTGQFQSSAFLNTVLEGEEETDEVKALLDELNRCETNQRRTIFMKLSDLYWQLVDRMAIRLTRGDITPEKRLLIRFGMLDDRLMTDRQAIWNQLAIDKSRPEESGIYYLDEWLEHIGRGLLKPSMIDELALNGAKANPHASCSQALSYELLTVRRMHRMCVGPRANLVTILAQDYCHPTRENSVVTRGWLAAALAEMKRCDCTLCSRKYKGEEIEITPLLIVLPGYGQRAGCWEPYSMGHKRDSGPRIPICAFPPRSSKKALLVGLGEYRWEYAKADAMHYWMTEGLTGKWIGLFSTKEQRKDLKSAFIDCYYHWMVYESRRIPKLNKRVREFFWYNVPFADEIKQQLKGGGLFQHFIELEEAKKKREKDLRAETGNRHPERP